MLRNRKFACFSFAAIIFIILPLVLSCDKKQVAAPEEKPYASASEAVKNQNAAAGIEDYMAILSLDSPQVAEPHAGAEPDRGLYYQSWESGVNQIYRRDGDETRAVTSAAQFPEGTDFFSLSPHGEYMVIGADVGGDEQFDLYIKDMRANTAPQPFDSGRESRAENPVWYDDKGRLCLAYRSTARNGCDFDFYSYCPQDGAKRIIKEMSGYNWITDLRDGKILYTHYLGGNLADIYMLDMANGAEKRLSPDKRSDGFYGGARFASDDSVFYLSDDERDFQTLFRLDPQSSEKRRVSVEDWPVEDFALDDYSDAGAYIYNENGVSRLVLSTAAVLKAPSGPIRATVL